LSSSGMNKNEATRIFVSDELSEKIYTKAELRPESPNRCYETRRLKGGERSVARSVAE